MVRVGLIGFGLAGQAFHAPVIRGVPGMELACILERHGSNAKAKYPEVRVARTLDEMLSDKTINLCVVATPNDSHYSYTKACLRSGPRRGRRQAIHADDGGSGATGASRRRSRPPGHRVSRSPLGRSFPDGEEAREFGRAGHGRRVRVALRSLPAGDQAERLAGAGGISCCRRSLGSRSAFDRWSAGIVWRAGDDLCRGALSA